MTWRALLVGLLVLGCRRDGLPREECSASADALRARLEANAEVSIHTPIVQEFGQPYWAAEPLTVPTLDVPPGGSQYSGSVAFVDRSGRSGGLAISKEFPRQTAQEVARDHRVWADWMAKREAPTHERRAGDPEQESDEVQLHIVSSVEEDPDGLTRAEADMLGAEPTTEMRVLIVADEHAPAGKVADLLTGLVAEGVDAVAVGVRLASPPPFDSGTPNADDAALLRKIEQATMARPIDWERMPWLGQSTWARCIRSRDELYWDPLKYVPGMRRARLWAPRAAALYERCRCRADPDELVWLMAQKWPPPTMALLPVDLSAEGTPFEVEAETSWGEELPRLLAPAKDGPIHLPVQDRLENVPAHLRERLRLQKEQFDRTLEEEGWLRRPAPGPDDDDRR